MSEKETKSYREDYYKSLERLEEQSSIAFSHAQAVSIIVLRTGILLNAGALAALATAVATSPDIRFHEQDFFPLLDNNTYKHFYLKSLIHLLVDANHEAHQYQH